MYWVIFIIINHLSSAKINKLRRPQVLNVTGFRLINNSPTHLFWLRAFTPPPTATDSNHRTDISCRINDNRHCSSSDDDIISAATSIELEAVYLTRSQWKMRRKKVKVNSQFFERRPISAQNHRAMQGSRRSTYCSQLVTEFLELEIHCGEMVIRNSLSKSNCVGEKQIMRVEPHKDRLASQRSHWKAIVHWLNSIRRKKSSEIYFLLQISSNSRSLSFPTDMRALALKLPKQQQSALSREHQEQEQVAT